MSVWYGRASPSLVAGAAGAEPLGACEEPNAHAPRQAC